MRKALWMSALAALLLAGTAYAQEVAGGGRIEVGAFPGGGLFFTQADDGSAPDFGNYALGGSFTVNVNPWIGLEGEGGAALGVRQEFNVGPVPYTHHRTPNMYMYSGNVVVNPLRNVQALVPYATGGLGGLTMSPRGEAKDLGYQNHETYLTGNVGGGLKWFSTKHFGVRGDYRFFMVRNKDNAPLFFGTGTRHGHRVQAGLIFTY